MNFEKNIEEYLCPDFSYSLKQHLKTPPGADPIKIDTIDGMRMAIDSVLTWMVDAGVFEMPQYKVRPYQVWSACRTETQLVNDKYNTVIQNTSINTTGVYSKFAEEVLAWMTAMYGNINRV